MLNKALEEVNDISKKMKALAESNMAMKEELSRVQENLENMTKEEVQLLEGTSDKFQVVESAKTILNSEDANDNEDVVDLDEFLDINELVPRFSDPDRSLNYKRERFKIFEVKRGSNRDNVIINLIMN